MKINFLIINIAIIIISITKSTGQNFNPTSYISASGSINNFVGGYTFSYATSGSPWNGALMSFGGFYNTYDCQISTDYGPNGGKHMSFRTKNGDNNTWNTWNEIWHSSNLNNNNSDFNCKNLNSNGNIDASGHCQVVGPLYTRENLYTVNKAANDWIPWATRNSYTSEATIDLSHINNASLYGSIGIGTSILDGKVVIAENGSALTIGSGAIGFNRNYVDGKIYDNSNAAWQINGRNDGFSIQGFNGALNEPFKILKNGNIGIGTPNPTFKLDVIGTIRAREIKVDLLGADFVFESDFKLMPLCELEKYINEQKHLPEVASAKEMKENGTDLGNLNSKLLQKVEELTLYAIEQNKSLKEQAKKNEEQAIKIEALEKAVNNLISK